MALVALSVPALLTSSAHAQGGAVVNDHGILVKLITIQDCRLHEEADRESPASPCQVFRFWYVLPPDPDAPSNKAKDLESLTKNDFYRVSASPGEREMRGWLHKEDVVEWHHRQALRFPSTSGRELVHFFQDPEQAKAFAETGALEGADFREPEVIGGRTMMLMPLLSRKEIQVGEETMDRYEIAFISGEISSGDDDPGITEQITQEEARKASTVDFVFVIDSTGSMADQIEMVKRSIENVSKNLAADEELREKLRFGLVAYRDIVDGMSYVSKRFCSLEEGKDHGAFLSALGRLQVAKVSSEDYAEDVLAGVTRAMDPDLGWSEFAWRNIIVVGDSSMKGPDHDRPESKKNQGNRTIASVRTQAQPSLGRENEGDVFVISAVRILDPDAAPDHPISARQFGNLCTGRTYLGEVLETRGGKNPVDFSDKLTAWIFEAWENYKSSVVHGQGPALGAGDATARAVPASSARFPLPLLQKIGNLPSKGEDDAEPQALKQRFAPQFDAEGNRLFIPHIFVRRGQLTTFSTTLSFMQGCLEDIGDRDSGNVKMFLDNMKLMTATLNIEDELDKDTEMGELFAVITGLPLRNKIFRLSADNLVSMSKTDYDDWVAEIKVCTDSLERLLENPALWKPLAKGARERDYHAFISLTDLP